MKIRVPPELAIKAAFEALGANTQTIAFQEVYLALANKTVDGQDNPIGTTFAAKFFEVQSHIALTRHIYASIMFAANPQGLAEQARRGAAPDRAPRRPWPPATPRARACATTRRADAATMQKAGVAITRPDVAPFRDKMATGLRHAAQEPGRRHLGGLDEAGRRGACLTPQVPDALRC